MSNKIPTAEEFLINWTGIDNSTHPDKEIRNKFIQNKNQLIEFTKLHVKAALKEALESIPCLGSSTDIATYEEVEKAVLNAYPEDLIK